MLVNLLQVLGLLQVLVRSVICVSESVTGVRSVRVLVRYVKGVSEVYYRC